MKIIPHIKNLSPETEEHARKVVERYLRRKGVKIDGEDDPDIWLEVVKEE